MKLSSASNDRICWCVVFKDLGPRLPFEIGGVWTGDLSFCDWTFWLSTANPSARILLSGAVRVGRDKLN